MIEVTRTHLELRSLDGLRRASSPATEAPLAERRLSVPEYLELYELVGGPWQWRDRLRMDRTALEAYLASPDVHVWTMRANGETAGYFELRRYADARVEIMYFGLAPSFMGRGLGGWMLTRAVEEAFALGASHVTLHTCTLDAPAALPNYLARGFV
ncbi:MAG: GNAT family N-acetyltransferase, partial [Gemmatimonadaceae bacterium]